MAELLIRVVDKVNPDFYLNCRCTKRGDVIVVQPDGWGWGREELTAPQWRLLRVTGLAVADVVAFLAPEPAQDPQQPSQTLQRRAFTFDLDHPNWPAAVKNFVADASRAQPMFAVTLTPAQVEAIKVRKPPIQDPAVFGVSAAVY